MSPDQVRIAIIGHVDHGKSTLIGRLMNDAGVLPDGTREKLAAAASQRGSSFEWAHVMDALRIERDQNVTIETAQICLRTPHRSYVLIDTPGHREFVRNMVTGAALADGAALVVDVQEGVREQSQRHARLLALLGVRELIAVVNKMDVVDYSEAAFRSVAADINHLLDPLGFRAAVLPVSARHGDNLVEPSPRMRWFEGSTMMEALSTIRPRAQSGGGPLRMPVQGVYRFDHRRVIVGRIEVGRIRTGDSIALFPGNRRSEVKSLESWNTPRITEACAGDSVALTLVDDIFVERGTVIAAGELPIEARSFSGRIFWLGRRPLGFGRAQKLRLTTQEASCTVELAGSVLDGATLEPCAGRDDRLESNEIAEVRIRTTRSIALDLYANVRSTGRFVLVDDTDIAGGGIVTDVSSVTPGHSAPMVRVSEYISPEMRELRQGHRGGVVWFTGLPASGKSTLAGALERALFEAGHQVFVLDGDDLRGGLNADLGFSPADRAENIRRTAEVAKLFAEAGIVAVTAFISPYASDRLRARRIIAQSGIDLPFIEVFVDAPLAVCEERDPKGLYAHARAGRIEQFTGVSAPYERPGEPEMTVRTAEHTVEECVSQLLACVLPVLARR